MDSLSCFAPLVLHFIFVQKPLRTKYTKIKCIRNILDLQLFYFDNFLSPTPPPRRLLHQNSRNLLPALVNLTNVYGFLLNSWNDGYSRPYGNHSSHRRLAVVPASKGQLALSLLSAAKMEGEICARKCGRVVFELLLVERVFQLCELTQREEEENGY